MPQTITNEQGEQVEVFNAEEIQAQKEAAIEEYKTANPDKTEELDNLQSQLAEVNEELEKLKGKDLNFENLRTQKVAAEKKASDLAKGIDDKIGNVKKEILESVLVDHYNDTLNSLSGDDPELKKKIEFQYKRLGDAAGTKEEVLKKLTDAWVLATKPEGIDAMNSTVLSSGGVRRLKINSNQSFTAEEKAMAQKLANAGGLGTLKDEDFR